MKIENYKIKGWKQEETGLLIDENDDWVLVKHIPVDYVIDGYKLYPKKYIKSRQPNEDAKQIARVFKLKNVSTSKPKKFAFGSVLEVLRWVEKRYGLFEFQDGEESELFYGKLNGIRKNKFIIDAVLTNGKIDKEYEYEFSLNKIRSITFGSNYFESIRLLMKDQKKK